MLGEICAEIKNYFTFKDDKHIGDFSIEDGQLVPSFIIPTDDYIRIVGSHKNDGVHKRDEHGSFGLIDEDKFHGGVWVMSPPADFLALVTEIEAWEAKFGNLDNPAMSPFNSESFGGYSYSKSAGGSGSGTGSGGGNSWESVYGSRLNQYRRIRVV